MSKPAMELKGRAGRLARLLPTGRKKAARAPFVLLVVLLLGGGLISLLVLNSALNAGSFQLSKYEKRNTQLTDEEQALQRDVDDRSAPGALAERARELGMVPGGSPVFLNPDGTVRGLPTEATAQPAAVQAAPQPSAPQPSVSATPASSAPPSGTWFATPAGSASPSGTWPPAPSVMADSTPAYKTAEPTPTPGR